MVQRVERLIIERGLLANGDVALVAVSGGVDSMVMLHVLHLLSAKHKWKLVVAHLNHRLRGQAADLDEKFVALHAAKLGLRCEVAREDVKEFARTRKLSIEMAARELRHEFLARTARALGIGKIALAHHADDQVELFFLRLLRGAGTQGLGGMQTLSPSPADRRVHLVRPLLRESKAALTRFAKAETIPFRKDATNASPDILRNRIRHKLLPLLEKEFQPQLSTTVLRSMELLRDEAGFVTHEAARWLSDARSAKSFDKLHVALQRRILQVQLLTHAIVPQFEHIESLRFKPGEWLSLGAETFCRRNADGRVELRKPSGAAMTDNESSLLLGRKGTATFESLNLHWQERAGRKLPVKTTGKEVFDRRAVGDPVLLRHWRPGDRFQPIGMRQAVKLQDLFVNQKIPRECRHKLVLATTASGEIFWVEGLRIGDNFKVTPATKHTLEWRWRREETQVAAPEGEC